MRNAGGTSCQLLHKRIRNTYPYVLWDCHVCRALCRGICGSIVRHGVWHLILTQGFSSGTNLRVAIVLCQVNMDRLGTVFAWLPATPILPNVSTGTELLAQGIAAAGSSISGIVFSSATTPLIQKIFLAWSLRITGVLGFEVLATAQTLIRDRNKSIRPDFKAIDISLLKRYQVWLLMAYTFFSNLGYIVTVYSLGKAPSDHLQYLTNNATRRFRNLNRF